ncbi:MAG TPA: amidohydrolase family protein [Actinomycetota bacterium]|nr:amidohydrolase family protein [Actinomycetota bacterium]
MPDPPADLGGAVTSTLYLGCAMVDHTTRSLAPEMAMLVTDGRVGWLGPAEEAPVPGPAVEVVDAGGTTAVAGMVDAHSHLTLPGGSHWIDRASDPADRLLAVAEDNARLLRQAGVRWARDVGAPVRDGRALSLTVRERWRGRAGYPYIRAAGCWVARTGSLPSGLPVEVEDGDGLLAAALGQLDAGADLVKLYMDGPDRDTSPFTAEEVRRTVEAVHARGATVTAHSSLLPGARAAVAAGVDALEHGFRLDAKVARVMAAQGTALVSTLAVMESWASFETTTRLPRFASAEGRLALAERREAAHESVRLAYAAGVLIAAGTDFGGGSLRANQLAWEVETLVAAGLEPYDALAAATVNGGRLLGEPGAGALEQGGPADFLLVHGDPLTDPGSLWRVWRTSW